MMAHLSHKASRKGHIVALNHPRNVVLPGLYNFDILTGCPIVIGPLH